MNLINQFKNVRIGIINLLKSDIGLYYIVRVFGLGITLTINLLLLKNISPSLYGNWTIVTLLIAIGVILVSLGSRKFAYTFKIIHDGLINKLISQIVFTSIVFSMIVYFLFKV